MTSSSLRGWWKRALLAAAIPTPVVVITWSAEIAVGEGTSTFFFLMLLIGYYGLIIGVPACLIVWALLEFAIFPRGLRCTGVFGAAAVAGLLTSGFGLAIGIAGTVSAAITALLIWNSCVKHRLMADRAAAEERAIHRAISDPSPDGLDDSDRGSA